MLSALPVPVSRLAVMATNVDPLVVLLNYGGLGAGLAFVFYLFLTGKIHTDGEMQDVKNQRDALAEANTDLQAQLIGHTLPTLARTTNLIRSLPEGALAEADAVRHMEQLAARYEALLARVEGATDRGK